MIMQDMVLFVGIERFIFPLFKMLKNLALKPKPEVFNFDLELG